MMYVSVLGMVGFALSIVAVFSAFYQAQENQRMFDKDKGDVALALEGAAMVRN